MTRKAPGKPHRKVIGLKKLLRMFPDDEAARKRIEEVVWPGGPSCPHCGTIEVQRNVKHNPMKHRCRECRGRPRISVKTGSVLQFSKPGCRTRAIAAHLVATSLKSVSSMKLHRDLEITQKTAWHLAHRLRKSCEAGLQPVSGPVEADDARIGGQGRSKHLNKTLNAGRGSAGKATVAGMKDRGTNGIAAEVAPDAKASALQGFAVKRTQDDAQVYTVEGGGYAGMDRPHESARHGAGEHVRDQAHANGIESFWSMPNWAHKGTVHKSTGKHLQRQVNEFAGRRNIREQDIIDQMQGMVPCLVGMRLMCKQLIANHGLSSGARP